MISFHNDSGSVFTSWRCLAENAPWALLDVSTLTKEQRVWLLAELQPYVKQVREKKGNEVEYMTVSIQSDDRLNRFATANLPRMQRNTNDPLADAEAAATSFVVDAIGGYEGLLKTLVRKETRQWQIVTPKHFRDEGKVACDRLIDLFILDLEPRLSTLWHAVKVLVCAAEAKELVSRGDAEQAVLTGIEIGKSYKALSFKSMESSNARVGGLSRQGRYDARNKQIREEADELRATRPGISDAEIARKLKGRPEVSVSERTIRKIVASQKKSKAPGR